MTSINTNTAQESSQLSPELEVVPPLLPELEVIPPPPPPNSCEALTKKGFRCKHKGLYLDSKQKRVCGIHIEKKTDTCVICLRNLYDEYILHCGHSFHSKCIMHWFKYKNTCPICRQIILDDYSQEELIFHVTIHLE